MIYIEIQPHDLLYVQLIVIPVCRYGLVNTGNIRLITIYHIKLYIFTGQIERLQYKYQRVTCKFTDCVLFLIMWLFLLSANYLDGKRLFVSNTVTYTIARKSTVYKLILRLEVCVLSRYSTTCYVHTESTSS